MSKLKIGVEEAKTARLCCCSLIIAHFEQALVEQKWKFDYQRICLLFSCDCIWPIFLLTDSEMGGQQNVYMNWKINFSSAQHKLLFNCSDR